MVLSVPLDNFIIQSTYVYPVYILMKRRQEQFYANLSVAKVIHLVKIMHDVKANEIEM